MTGCRDHGSGRDDGGKGDGECEEVLGAVAPDGTVLVAIADLVEAKRLRSALEPKGIHVRLVSNPATCTSGKCGVKVEMRVLAEELVAFREFLDAERSRVLVGLDVDPSLLEQVFDPSATHAVCPACGTRFSTKSAECPDCGLVFTTE